MSTRTNSLHSASGKPSMIVRRKPGKSGRSRAGQIGVAALCFQADSARFEASNFMLKA